MTGPVLFDSISHKRDFSGTISILAQGGGGRVFSVSPTLPSYSTTQPGSLTNIILCCSLTLIVIIPLHHTRLLVYYCTAVLHCRATLPDYPYKLWISQCVSESEMALMASGRLRPHGVTCDDVCLLMPFDGQRTTQASRRSWALYLISTRV